MLTLYAMMDLLDIRIDLPAIVIELDQVTAVDLHHLWVVIARDSLLDHYSVVIMTLVEIIDNLLDPDISSDLMSLMFQEVCDFLTETSTDQIVQSLMFLNKLLQHIFSAS